MYYLFQNICIYKHVDIHSQYNTSASFILRSVEEDCFKHTISFKFFQMKVQMMRKLYAEYKANEPDSLSFYRVQIRLYVSIIPAILLK